MTENASILEQLDSDLYLAGDQISDRYSVDWSKERPFMPPVVLRPRDTNDVSKMLALCAGAKQKLVIQGGLTGLSGGATPMAGEWAMSLERLNSIVKLDTDNMCLTVGAGTPLERIQDIAADAGFQFPLDLGARGTCTAGGIVSTNAGGNQVIQYGMTRALVLGLVAVLADGTVIPAHNMMLKNNAGFDLKQLFIGGEGALGVVTEITFRLFPAKNARETALCGLTSFSAVAKLLQRMGRELDSISSFEVMWKNYIQASLEANGIADPLGGDWPFYVLLETTGANQSATEETFQQALAGAMEDGLIADAVIAQSQAEGNTLWAIRDGIAELLSTYQPAANFDIGLPVSEMEAFTSELDGAMNDAFPDCKFVVFGHIGDGNLHLLATTGDAEDVDRIYDFVYKRLGKHGGTITAEHGIGRLKIPWLADCRSESELALMRTLKDAMDPNGILNAGRAIS